MLATYIVPTIIKCNNCTEPIIKTPQLRIESLNLIPKENLKLTRQTTHR